MLIANIGYILKPPIIYGYLTFFYRKLNKTYFWVHATFSQMHLHFMRIFFLFIFCFLSLFDWIWHFHHLLMRFSWGNILWTGPLDAQTCRIVSSQGKTCIIYIILYQLHSSVLDSDWLTCWLLSYEVVPGLLTTSQLQTTLTRPVFMEDILFVAHGGSFSDENSKKKNVLK